jgi:hypothetical protein
LEGVEIIEVLVGTDQLALCLVEQEFLMEEEDIEAWLVLKA